MQHISLLALPSCLFTSLTMPLEMLSSASDAARSRNRHLPGLQSDIVAINPQPFATTAGITVNATATIADIQQTDLVILPSLWRNPVTTIRKHPEVIRWLNTLAASGCVICAVGTSSFLLAEAGLLDNKPATTHWFYCDRFSQLYPKVDLKRQYLITQADNIYCAASINSIADLMVHLIEKIYGAAIARKIESQFSPEIRRPFGQHAYSEAAANPHHDELIVNAQEWLRDHHNETVNLCALAEQLGLSMRSFNRRFKQSVGITASEYLQQQRLNSARELLRTSNLTVHEVALAAGYQDSSYFCMRFKKLHGQTPLSYRKAARGKLFNVV